MQYVIARPAAVTKKFKETCSVIIPCYNEEANIAECIRRVPPMGISTEIVVVDDGSHDKTLQVAREMAATVPNITIISFEKNRGKGAAVVEGIRKASGDIVMILDADMAVPPEETNEFYEAVASGAADFASGTRFLYPMERDAMRFANYIGNILFSKLVQIIVNTECSDTLCGTKAMRKKDFEGFQLEDSSWGDFDLIFHAAKRKLRSVQIPVHYKSRIAGVSKMKAFRSGVKFLTLCLRKWAILP